ncbi:MerC family mercury resistance protein [Marinobacter sp. HL-58]|uniref:MerC family mercury resistance protein n=1 Tax=Marinobacter sp. HL-58 TaxID=1479237 RepID=UPI0004814CEE|nr:MerC family mercury resistance protein [Marinobacter sp. HL-58]KPP97989.1 MAG: Methylase involved in ubiquinone/menaquinone biosynthesis [Marinobacter sp. HL-58]
MVAILGYSPQQITEAVQEMYTTVAERPSSPFHFPVGKQTLALLGYDARDTEPLPENVAASFAGVGNPFRAKALQPGDTALDIGAGAGNDTLIAGRKVGPDGKVIALDLTAAMTRKIRHNTAGRCPNVDVVQASAEQLPVATGSIDCITSNGALNLVPDKRRAIREMFRVLRPGGRLQLADVVINRPVNVDCDSDPRLWVECVVGATVEESLIAMLEDTGFEDIRVLNRLDYFAHSPSQQTREIARSFGAHSIELTARRADRTPGRLRQWLRPLHPRRWLADLHRRGLLGVATLLLALVSCYGALAAAGLLAALGVGLALDPGVWAGTIALFATFAAGFIAAGFRYHRSIGPTVFAMTGVALVLYALFVDYSVMTELTGFVVMIGAAARDLYLRRYEEARKLGLKGRGHT